MFRDLPWPQQQQPGSLGVGWLWSWPADELEGESTCTSPSSSGPLCSPYTQWLCCRWCQSSCCLQGGQSGSHSPRVCSSLAGIPDIPREQKHTPLSLFDHMTMRPQTHTSTRPRTAIIKSQFTLLHVWWSNQSAQSFVNLTITLADRAYQSWWHIQPLQLIDKQNRL